MNYRAARFFIVAMLGATAVACTAGRPRVPAERTSIAVENQAFADANVYVRDTGGQRRRLGTATGLTTTVFTIPVSLVGNGRELHFEVDPIGGMRTRLTNSLYVTPGDQVRMVIPPG